MPDVVPYPAALARRYREEGAWRGETIGARLRLTCRERPSATAVITPSAHLTFAELDEQSDRVGAAYHRSGLRPGDRVIFQIANTAEGVLAYYGAIKAGLVPVCSIAGHGERDVLMLAERTDPRGYVFQADHPSVDLAAVARRVAGHHRGLDVLIGLGGVGDVALTELIGPIGAAEAQNVLGAIDARPGDVAVLQLSGGTTGTPKLIPRLHEEYVYNATQWATTWGWSSESVLLHPIPLMHNAGLAGALHPAHLCGAAFATLPRPNAAAILDMIESAKVTVVPVTPPALLRDLLDAQRAEPRDISSLRQLVVAGQKLDESLAERLEADLQLDCLQNFGMSEGMFMVTPPGAPGWVRKRTVGRPISPLDEVRLLQPGTERDVAEGDVGELCCRGPYTVRGYYADPERNRVAFTSDGFYRTGDLARAHPFEGGHVYSVEGRIKDTINRGAEKISVEDVESVLLMHPGIASVAVVAMPDERLGEKACAYVVPPDPDAMPTLEEVVAFCLDQGMAKFKLPERLEQISALPLANIGKVDKQLLRDDVAAKLRPRT